MKAALAAVAFVPLALLSIGFALGFAAGCSARWFLEQFARLGMRLAQGGRARQREAVPLRKGSGEKPTTPRPAFPVPALDPRYLRARRYRGMKES